MAGTNFVDYVKICCRSGNGGSGSAHLHRDRLTMKGGPDGGDGGRGGHVIVRGNSQLWTLLHLKYRKHVIAGVGDNGSKSLSSGKTGRDEIIDVPLGTIAKDSETGDFLFEITEDGEEYIIVDGGKGGLGNSHFKSSTNQTPRYAQTGMPGKEEWKILELKILADVGLVGFPNAGKSTLLSVVSAAKPEIANYPFTTLVPNLGIVSYRDHKSFVMADIPGIIEGAAEGKGLGIRFLRHIERNSSLLFLVPADSDDIKKEYNILLNELKKYNPELLDKSRILAISKSDMLDDELKTEIEADLPDIQALENLDYNLFRILNDIHSPMWDTIMWWISYKWVWIPLYLLIIFLFYRTYGIKGALISLLGAGIIIGITDLTVTYGLKNTVMRYRPSHNLDFSHLIHLVKDFNGEIYKGGQYGFVSGHAANSFAIAIFCSRLLKKRFKWIGSTLILWAMIVSYSRVYLGVHYPADIICGAIIGGIFGYMMSLAILRLLKKTLSKV